MAWLYFFTTLVGADHNQIEGDDVLTAECRAYVALIAVVPDEHQLSGRPRQHQKTVLPLVAILGGSLPLAKAGRHPCTSPLHRRSLSINPNI